MQILHQFTLICLLCERGFVHYYTIDSRPNFGNVTTPLTRFDVLKHQLIVSFFMLVRVFIQTSFCFLVGWCFTLQKKEEEEEEKKINYDYKCYKK